LDLNEDGVQQQNEPNVQGVPIAYAGNCTVPDSVVYSDASGAYVLTLEEDGAYTLVLPPTMLLTGETSALQTGGGIASSSPCYLQAFGLRGESTALLSGSQAVLFAVFVSLSGLFFIASSVVLIHVVRKRKAH
jgi:hypothetical protein